MNKILIEKWIAAVGLDNVIKSPFGAGLLTGARAWAKDTIDGLEYEKSLAQASLVRAQAEIAKLDTKIRTGVVREVIVDNIDSEVAR